MSFLKWMTFIQNIRSLYKHQTVRLQNGNTFPRIVERLDGDAVEALSHIASSPYMLDLSTHQPFTHARLIETSGEHVLMMSTLITKGNA